MMQQTIRVFLQQHGRPVPSHLRSAFKADAFRINGVEVIGERPAIGRLPTGRSFHQHMTRHSFSIGSFLLRLSRACLGILCTYIIVFDKEVVENGEPKKKTKKKKSAFSLTPAKP
jgi:hypothetical protein